MSKFKLAIKLLYGPCQTIATLGGGFDIKIKYVMMEFLGHLLKQAFLFLSYLSALSQGNFFLTVYWATFAISTHYESPPLLFGSYSREKDVCFWALLSPLYPSSSGRVKSTSPLHKGKRICVGDVPLVLGLISSYHLKCKLSSEELTPVFKIDFEVLPCN